MSNIIHIPKPKPLFTPVKYGLLYNWYAATDSRNITNTGWRVPTNSDFVILANYVGDYMGSGDLYSNGYKFKDTDANWGVPSVPTNETKFNAMASGYRIFGSFSQMNTVFYIWSQEHSVVEAFRLEQSPQAYDYVIIQSNYTEDVRNHGMSLRLIKESTSLVDGESGTYTGNDGKIYRTICIGTQEWIADNLCETKYRNGDLIPEVTNATTWSDLTTGALCAYNNDWNNV